MKTIKSYTDIAQSRKLAEILPLESADAFYDMAEPEKRQKPVVGSPDEYLNMEDWVIPCWSLAALLDIIPNVSIEENVTYGGNTWFCTSIPKNTEGFESNDYDTPIDACYKMILKLHELNLL